MKILALLVEPAEYTLDLVKNIYKPNGVEYVFLKKRSLASCEGAKGTALDELPFFSRIVKMYRLLKGYEAFNVNGYTGISCAIFIWLNVLFFRKPFSIDSDTELIIPKKPAKRFLKWLWLHFIFTRRYCFGFAGGNFGHKDLFRHYGMAEERIYLMPMVVDNAKFKRQEQVAAHKPFRFGYLGRLVQLKQVDKIIKALPPESELHIVGDGEAREDLERLTQGKTVTFHGKTFGDRKIELLNSFDCLVLYSAYESWGLVVNEALSAGIPVVVSDKIGARRDLVEGEAPTGLVAKWDDVEDLKRKFSKLATDSELWSSLSANALKRMQEWNYTLYNEQYKGWTKTISRRI